MHSRDARGTGNIELKVRIAELEKQLRSACAVQVKQAQQVRYDREQKMWDRLEQHYTTRTVPDFVRRITASTAGAPLTPLPIDPYFCSAPLMTSNY